MQRIHLNMTHKVAYRDEGERRQCRAVIDTRA
jgi:hypothetical protein